MKRVSVFALLLLLGVIPALSQSQSQTAAQQAQTAAQQAQTAAQQSATAAQQSATAQQQSQTAAQQTQIAHQQVQQAQQAQAANQPQSDQQWMAEQKTKQADRLRASNDVMKTVLTGKFAGKGLVESAKCVVIFPSEKRAGFIVGVGYARGAMSCRLGEDFKGPWSAPSMTALEGGSFGLQIGLQNSDVVLFVMNQRGVNSLLSSKSKLGVDASVAGGPFGRGVSAATDMGMKADIVAIARNGGAYAGAILNGTSLRPDGTGNQALYGRELTNRQILRSGEVPVPPAGRPLIQTLDQTRTVAAAPAGGDNK
ncbi:MAG TPA: lipid-binding SYLF domain-containing protein [Candidatus Angelobacter sp.]|nr:lipid-binding SYLF domain-containing protein [Candidatus Angelobacter sp.]